MRSVLLAIALALPITACSNAEQAQGEVTSKITTVTIDELDQNLTHGDCTPVDANGDATRKRLGVIPGAVLLSDSDAFSVRELPADKSRPLVFYCANTHCGASHEAAGRAITAGYTNVRVLPDGIAGWVKAGKHVAQPSS